MAIIRARTNLREALRGLDDCQRAQVPFAIATALNAVGRKVVSAQVEGIEETFNNPTPFTRRGVRMQPARKSNLVVTIFMMDVQAAYLEPFDKGGVQVLGTKRAILMPRQQPVNQYGNLPKGKLAALKAKQGVFVGAVRTKSGQIVSGLWQRPAKAGRVRRGRAAMPTRLKLLIQFTAPKPVKQRLHWDRVSQEVVDRELLAAFDVAMAAAMASAR